jgi:hypothetical protein
MLLPFGKYARDFRGALPRGQSGAGSGDAQQRLRIEEDAFQRHADAPKPAEVVTAVWTPELSQAVEAAMQAYQSVYPEGIPPARRVRVGGRLHWLAKRPENDWRTNRAERLAAVFWILSQMAPATEAAECVNGVACVLETVEKEARQRARQLKLGDAWDPKLMRLAKPFVEEADGQWLQVSYGVRHAILFKADGALQIQTLPTVPQKLNYRKRACQPNIVLLDKPGPSGEAFWPV